jgi:hypothetical protein
MDKTLVLYVFHIYTEYVDHFIKKCIFYDDKIDFIVICNDRNIVFEVPTHVKKIQRDNVGFDFGGWTQGLLENNLYLDYSHFIFVNSSVIGPFIAPYYDGKWTDIYLNGLKNNIKLFGSTINTCEDPLNLSHVQSYIFALDKYTLEYLMECKIFDMNNHDKSLLETVRNKEIMMSRKILEKGWNIGSLLQCYKNVDFTFTTRKPHEYNIPFYNDLMYGYNRGSLWDEYSLVFIKVNRIRNEKTLGHLMREFTWKENAERFLFIV